MTTQQKTEENLKTTVRFSRNKLKYAVNEQFFNNWTNQMAYVLGFTFADGNIHKTSLSWDVQLKDKEILKKIKKALKANYPISLQRKKSYRLRINNQILINGAIKRGLLPKKNIRNELPNMPWESSRHFIRGYLDGDGWIVFRKKRKDANEFDLGFSSGNKEFLSDIGSIISRELGIKATRVRKRIKLTPKKVLSVSYMVEFYSQNAFKIAQWLYKDLIKSDLFLNRKYRKYLEGARYYNLRVDYSRLATSIQRRNNQPLSEILIKLRNKNNMNGVQMAKVLNVHSSSIYRWLARTGVKYPERKVIHSYG